MSLNLRSTAAALALVFVTTAAAQASPLSFQSRGGESFLSTAWEWLTSWVLPVSKAGGMMDPDGEKAGGMMDPNGRTEEAVPSGFGLDAGGMMDPDGLR
ncbi:MAG TPA: hypothetical protein VJ725_15085 [Thermoanaerobaculia bacterium]|nr:hypothetical protein [Thermoanaerobaculia bacterium]